MAMDIPHDVIQPDPQSRWLAALRAGVCTLVLVVGFFILSSMFGGTAAHATSETEPGAADSSLVGTVSSVVSGVTDPQAADLQSLGDEVAEPLDAVLSELPVVPEIVGETPVQGVVSPVLHTAERMLEIIPEIESVVEKVPTTAAPVNAPTTVVSITVDPSPITASASATAPRGAAAPSLVNSRVPLPFDQPMPVSSTASTGISAGSTGAPPAVDQFRVGWSSPVEGVESSSAHNDPCPPSATYDSDSTPD
jgi:hypothetical protein